MTNSIDSLHNRPFEANLDYNIQDRMAGRGDVVENLASPNPEELPKEEPKEQLKEQPKEKRYHLWHEPRKIGFMFGRVYLSIIVMFLGFLSIYWGSLYHREYRVANAKVVVVIEDQDVRLSNNSMVPLTIGPAFALLLNVSRSYGDYVFVDVQQMNDSALRNNRTMASEIGHLIHRQEYWGGIYINSTASQTAFDLLVSANSLSLPAFQVQYVISAMYESGRHFSALSQYITKNMRFLEEAWLSLYAPDVYAHMMKYYLSSDERRTLIEALNNTNTSSALNVLPPVNMVDLRPPKSAAVLGPSELGLIYAQIFSFHQFNFLVDLHNTIQDKLRFRHYVTYRILFSQLNHFVLALVYALMTIAFQVPIDPAYGGPGFLVLWITMYLFISASGGISECFVSWVLFKDKKALLAPFMIFYIVINITPTFAPFVLCPGVYRYGYAMPMFNCYEALKVVFFDTWRGTLGRNYGILGAWVAASNVALVFILKVISDRTKAKLAAEADKEMEKISESS